MIKHKATDTKTDDSVIIDWGHIPQAPMNSNNKAVMIANLIPTVKYPIAENTPNVYHHGTWVKKISSGRKSLR